MEMVEKLANTQVREPVALPQVSRIDRRLSAVVIAELVQAYQEGASTTLLREQYELSQGSVIGILLSHGVVMRGHGLDNSNVGTAAELYRAGATLAQLGAQFEVSPNAVRRALIASGVVMRARGGSKPRS